MAAKHYATPKEIANQLDSEYFDPYFENINNTLDALQKNKPFALQVDLAGECLRIFWARYARKHIAKIFEKFPRIQRALFGLEEDPSSGMRYRDHYVHMFNVFITGSRILSQALNAIPKADKELFIKNVFKTTREPDDLPFPRPYTAKQRLFFLWTIISTFHDIGIPIEHLEKVRFGLNKFLKYFGLSLAEFQLEHRTHVTSQLRNYFEAMAKLYKSGIKPNSELLYDLPARGNQYLWHTLSNAYGDNDHGVISAVCLLNSYEETFLIGHHDDPDYDLTNEQYCDFISRVLEHDIARAALAISIHNLDSIAFPKIFPIDPDKFPLAFLLILCDEIQEPFRREGITFTGVSKLTRFPEIRVKVNRNNSSLYISIGICYIRLNETDENVILDAAKIWGKKKGVKVPEKYPEFLSWTWERISTVLRQKILLPSDLFDLRIAIYLERPGRNRMLICQELFK